MGERRASGNDIFQFGDVIAHVIVICTGSELPTCGGGKMETQKGGQVTRVKSNVRTTLGSSGTIPIKVRNGYPGAYHKFNISRQ